MQILTLHNTRGNLNFALHLVTIETLVNYLVEILIREDLYFNDIVYLYFFFLLIDYFNKKSRYFSRFYRVIKFRLSHTHACILFYLIGAMILCFCQHDVPFYHL